VIAAFISTIFASAFSTRSFAKTMGPEGFGKYCVEGINPIPFIITFATTTTFVNTSINFFNFSPIDFIFSRLFNTFSSFFFRFSIDFSAPCTFFYILSIKDLYFL